MPPLSRKKLEEMQNLGTPSTPKMSGSGVPPFCSPETRVETEMESLACDPYEPDVLWDRCVQRHHRLDQLDEHIAELFQPEVVNRLQQDIHTRFSLGLSDLGK